MATCVYLLKTGVIMCLRKGVIVMTTIDYLVTADGIIERGSFYNYLHKLGFKDELDREYMINSQYPFGLCLKKKLLLVVESATNCYLMQKNGKIKTVEEIKEMLGDSNE